MAKLPLITSPKPGTKDHVEIPLSGDTAILYHTYADESGSCLMFSLKYHGGSGALAIDHYVVQDRVVRTYVHAQPDFPQDRLWIGAMYNLDGEFETDGHFRDGDVLQNSRRIYSFKPEGRRMKVHIPVKDMKSLHIDPAGKEPEPHEYGGIKGYWVHWEELKEHLRPEDTAWFETGWERLEQTGTWVRELLEAVKKNPVVRPYYEACAARDNTRWKYAKDG